MVLSKAALQRVQSTLSSYYESSGRGLQILTEKQLERAMQYAKTRNASRGRVTRVERSAAVLVPLCSVGGQPSILFTLRSGTVGTHKHQISFPGGHAEEHDASPVDTALRETREELRGSYDYDNGITVLGETGPVPSITGNMVQPIVAALTSDDFATNDDVQRIFHNPSEEEVELVFTRTIEDLVRSETSEPLERLGSVEPCFPGPEGKIWGLTAIILRPLLRHVLVPAFFDGGKIPSKY